MATMNEKKKAGRRIKRHAFAILLYNVDATGVLRIFLAQANGPRYWVRQNENRWGLPKGQSDEDELPFEAASREYFEEIGAPLPKGAYRFFMENVRVKARRKVTVFASEIFDMEKVFFVNSNIQTREYPVKSGSFVKYAEIVDAQWFRYKQAKSLVLPGQKPILKKLKKAVKTSVK